MNQPTILDLSPVRFPESPPPHNGSSTSEATAAMIAPKTSRQRQKVYEFIKARGDHGATGEEVADGLNIPLSSATARMRELQGYGSKRKALPVLIIHYTIRQTKYQKPSKVWVAAEGVKS